MVLITGILMWLFGIAAIVNAYVLGAIYLNFPLQLGIGVYVPGSIRGALIYGLMSFIAYKTMNLFKEKESKTNKEIAIEKFKKAGLTFDEADYLAQDVAELSLYADKNLFSNEKDNVSNLEEAFKDKYYMETVNTIIKDRLPIKDIAYTGIKARALGLSFEERMGVKNSVFDYLKKNDIDNSHYREIFMRTIETKNSEGDESELIRLLYAEGWIDDTDSPRYIDITRKMVDKTNKEKAISQLHTIFEECKLWYSQVNTPSTPLQETTLFSVNWGKGRLEEIKNEILHSGMLPFDILIDTLSLKEQTKQAIESAIKYENFPKVDEDYKDEVAGRFIQYMQEEVRLNIINAREKGEEKTLDEILQECNENLPIQINDRFYIEQVYGGDESIRMIFKASKRASIPKDLEARDFIVNTMKDALFTKKIHDMGIEIFIQLLTESLQNIATATIDKVSDEDMLYTNNNRQKIIEKINIAEIDYSDIVSVSTGHQHNMLFFEMGEDEDFLLGFDNQKDLEIAKEMIVFKINFSPTTYDRKMCNYEEKVKLYRSLKYKKLDKV